MNNLMTHQAEKRIPVFWEKPQKDVSLHTLGKHRKGRKQSIKEQITMLVFHGSYSSIERPIIKITGFNKDFGYGFYCTNIEKQARRWALTKRPRHVVSVYEYTPNEALNALTFESMTEQWLDFIVRCRQGIPHSYDIVEGPMADDTIWDYIEDLVQGNITREAFWVLVKFKYPTHQLVFCTDKALESLTFKTSYEL